MTMTMIGTNLISSSTRKQSIPPLVVERIISNDNDDDDEDDDNNDNNSCPSSKSNMLTLLSCAATGDADADTKTVMKSQPVLLRHHVPATATVPVPAAVLSTDTVPTIVLSTDTVPATVLSTDTVPTTVPITATATIPIPPFHSSLPSPSSFFLIPPPPPSMVINAVPVSVLPPTVVTSASSFPLSLSSFPLSSLPSLSSLPLLPSPTASIGVFPQFSPLSTSTPHYLPHPQYHPHQYQQYPHPHHIPITSDLEITLSHPHQPPPSHPPSLRGSNISSKKYRMKYKYYSMPRKEAHLFIQQLAYDSNLQEYQRRSTHNHKKSTSIGAAQQQQQQQQQQHQQQRSSSSSIDGSMSKAVQFLRGNTMNSSISNMGAGASASASASNITRSRTSSGANANANANANDSTSALSGITTKEIDAAFAAAASTMNNAVTYMVGGGAPTAATAAKPISSYLFHNHNHNTSVPLNNAVRDAVLNNTHTQSQSQSHMIPICSYSSQARTAPAPLLPPYPVVSAASPAIIHTGAAGILR